MVKQTHYLFNLFSTDPRRRAQHYGVVLVVAEAVGTDWYYLGELGFAAEEDGRFAEARDLAEASLEAHPDNGSAAHVLADTYLETADLRQGDEWLSKWLRSWDAPSEFACHLTWHLALLRLADHREVDRELDAVLSFVGRAISVVPDGASLLWRLHLAGVRNLPWDTLVLPPNPPGFPHGDYHRAFVLAGLDDRDGLQDGRTASMTSTAMGIPVRGSARLWSRPSGGARPMPVLCGSPPPRAAPGARPPSGAAGLSWRFSTTPRSRPCGGPVGSARRASASIVGSRRGQRPGTRIGGPTCRSGRTAAQDAGMACDT